MADQQKEVKLDKRYRIFVRDDSEQMVVGMDESLFKYDSEGVLIPSEKYLIDYGNSITYTWVIGKYYEHDQADNVLKRYIKKTMLTNINQHRVVEE